MFVDDEARAQSPTVRRIGYSPAPQKRLRRFGLLTSHFKSRPKSRLTNRTALGEIIAAHTIEAYLNARLARADPTPSSDTIFRTICVGHIRDAEQAPVQHPRVRSRVRRRVQAARAQPGPHRVRAAHGVPVVRAPRPTRFVQDPTAHHYFHKWALQGVFERAWFDMARWYLYKRASDRRA